MEIRGIKVVIGKRPLVEVAKDCVALFDKLRLACQSGARKAK